MKHRTKMPSRALKGVLGLCVAAAASLALAGVASAQVIVIQPDNVGATDHLAAAINQANTDADASNVIVLSPGTYEPLAADVPMTIAANKSLTIVVPHSEQSINNTPTTQINGGMTGTSPADFLVVDPTASLTLEGVQFQAVGSPNFNAINDEGNLTIDDSGIYTSSGNEITVNSGATATLNETTLDDPNQNQIDNNGTLNLNNVSIIQGLENGIVNSGGTITMHNTILAFQSGLECIGGTDSVGATDASIDDDGSCGVQYSGDTNIDSYFPISATTQGGPTTIFQLPSGNPDTTHLGTNCPTTDQRFFVNTSAGCDIGAVTNDATQQTTAPACTVTGLITGPPKQQQVTLVDSQSGVGPEAGSQTDSPVYAAVNGAQALPESTLTVGSTTGFPSSGTLDVGGQTLTYTGTTSTTFTGVSGGTGTAANGAPVNLVPTAYPPAAAAPVPGDSVASLQVNNGSVMFTPTANPLTSGLVLTATKSNQGATTQWSFTGTNWAGISKNCF